MESVQHADYSKEEKPKIQWIDGKEKALKKHMKRRESVQTSRVMSTEIVPRLSQSTGLQVFQSTESEGAKWDPHIDMFDIIKEQLAEITRSMQELQVQELFHDELLLGNKRAESTESSEHGPIDSFVINSSSILKPFYLDDEEEIEPKTSTSINSLFVTTNKLIDSKIDEMTEKFKVQSRQEDSEWKDQFLKLVTECIQQSEALETLSVEMTSAEQKVKEFVFLQQSIRDTFQEQEKQYGERIQECEQVSQKQLMMMSSLEELMSNIKLKSEITPEKQVERWDFEQPVTDLLKMEDKQDSVYQMKWNVGTFVEQVEKEHVIQSFNDRLEGIDLMIAGNGAINIQHEIEQEEESNFISPTIRHIKFHQHHYVLHLTDRDRQTRFVLLSRDSWVPDKKTEICQFPLCTARFSLFIRRHHCRRCGNIVCQKHSENRLPLFSSKDDFEWCRVCDGCFQELIIKK